MPGGGGGGKRHFKGNNKSNDRNQRKERAEQWKNSRGDGETTNNQRGYDTPTTNPRMEAFYRAQNFIASAEWEDFLGALRSPLPACFRINHDYLFADELAQELQSFMATSQGKQEAEQGSVKPIERMDWYPNGYAYKLGTDRRNLRKDPALQQLHRWMIKHTDMGNITRQEAVSMVPPLALDVAPHHACLDMCAAPGSKTSQLLEVVDKSIHAPYTKTDGLPSTARVQGCVVANDADTDRAYMLVHQCKRINSPLLVVTTHQGQLFPKITNSTDDRDGYFDRVLCDVPCTGSINFARRRWFLNSFVNFA
jgi:16S rRNA C967 or C1407 C5-methylase (RsmB/RsmF family)